MVCLNQTFDPSASQPSGWHRTIFSISRASRELPNHLRRITYGRISERTMYLPIWASWCACDSDKLNCHLSMVIGLMWLHRMGSVNNRLFYAHARYDGWQEGQSKRYCGEDADAGASPASSARHRHFLLDGDPISTRTPIGVLRSFIILHG